MKRYANEAERFKKSFLLHSSRYNIYSKETLIKGSTKTHNQAIKALGKLQEKIEANQSYYADLLLELLQNNDPKVSLMASFSCLSANIHTEKAMNKIVYIANNTPELSLICQFDIGAHVTKFRKQQIDAVPRNEIDKIAEKMKHSDSKELYTDEMLLDMISELQSIDMCGHDGRTPLMHACINNHLVLAKKLVELGADVNKKDITEKNSLHFAVVVGNIELVTFLLCHQTNVNAQDKRGFTALDFAKANFVKLSQSEVEKMIEILVSYGAKTKNEILTDYQ